MTFTKLVPGITKSSLWSTPEHVRVVWVTFLAEKDEDGFVDSSYSGMRRTANLLDDPEGKKFDEAIKYLEAPDLESKTPDFEGRRIARVEGGWIVLNHEKYRIPEIEKKQKHAEYMREWRKNKNVNSQKITEVHTHSPSVSVSVSVSVSEFKEIFNTFRKLYPGTKRGNDTEFENFKKKHKDWKEVLPNLEKALKNQIGWRKEMKAAGTFVPEWKHLKTWINNRCWEDEKPVIDGSVANYSVNQDQTKLSEYQKKLDQEIAELKE